jgi:hypothetical protein
MDKMRRLRRFLQERNLLIVLLTAAILFMIYLAAHFIGARGDTLLSAAWVNEYQDISDGSELQNAFLEYLQTADGGRWLSSFRTDTPADQKKADERLDFDAGYYFKLNSDKSYSNSYFVKLAARIESGKLDVMILNEENLKGVALGGRVLDLGDKRAGSLAADYADRLIMYTDEDGSEIPIGLDITDSPILYGYAEEEGRICLAFSSNMKHAELAQLFARFMLDPDEIIASGSGAAIHQPIETGTQ